MITGRVLSSPKNAYFNVLGNGLSSSFGGDSDDEMRFFSNGASCSTLDFHLLVSMDGGESSRALTSLTDCQYQNQNQSELNIFVKGHH